jgi:2-polyprenyl-3-methyl-5-hydroxy-6-metoxy-1,4-benzoquinol methylase
MEDVGQTKQAYDKLAFSYDAVRYRKESMRRRGQMESDFILNSIRPGSRVLELGCGTGRITTLLLGAAESVTAVDISGEMLKVLRSKLGILSNLELIESDLFQLEDRLSLRTFDTVVCMRMLPHIRDVHSALVALTKFISPGGQMLFDLWNNHSLLGLGRKLLGHRHQIPTFHHPYDLMLQAIHSAELEVEQEYPLWVYPRLGRLSLDGINHRVLRRWAYSILFDARKTANVKKALFLST